VGQTRRPAPTEIGVSANVCDDCVGQLSVYESRSATLDERPTQVGRKPFGIDLQRSRRSQFAIEKSVAVEMNGMNCSEYAARLMA
jgi:hypothetical protein